MHCSIDGALALIIMLMILGGAIWLACWTVIQITRACFTGAAYLFHGVRPDSDTRIHLKALVAGLPFSDRKGDVWVRERDIPPRALALPVARTIGYVPGSMPRSPLHDLTMAPLAAERDEDDYTILWEGDGQTLSLVFINENLTAVVSPFHPDYPATKIRVADLLARTIWPIALQDETLACLNGPAPVRADLTSDIVDRLRGRFPMGPHQPNGEPEFGWRQFQTTPINNEAADIILRQRVQIENLTAKLQLTHDKLARTEYQLEDITASERF